MWWDHPGVPGVSEDPANRPRGGAPEPVTASGRAAASGSRLQPPATLQPPACLVRPPVAPAWAPPGALPAKQWPLGRRGPPSGRGKMPAVEQGAQAARPQQAPGACGGSTPRILLGSKLALFPYWL